MKASIPQTPPDLPSESMLPLWQRIMGEFRLHGQKWGLPPHIGGILISLYCRPSDSQPSLIAKAHYLPRQTVTFILDALERKKLIVRRSHPSDRRRKIIQLTAKGRHLADVMFRDLLEYESAALKELDTTELAATKRLLTRYAEALAIVNQRKSDS